MSVKYFLNIAIVRGKSPIMPGSLVATDTKGSVFSLLEYLLLAVLQKASPPFIG